MPFITQGKTNWKFLLIVIILAVIVGGGALWYVRRPEKPYQPVVIQKTIVKPGSIISPNNNFMAWHEEFENNYLIITNLLTKEQKEFAWDDLLSDDIKFYFDESWRIAREGKGDGLMPLTDFGKWSSDSKYLWGFVYLLDQTGDPIPHAASIFKINVENWQIEKFSIPRPGSSINYLSFDTLNLEKESILFEQNINEGITLYLYNLQSKKEETAISYPKEVLDEYYYGYFWWYVNGDPDKGNPRQLKPKWVDTDTISYVDLQTEKEILKKIEQ